MIEEGKPAPDFELQSDSGETVRLSDFRGKPVVLYFYPKDDTPGCTTEACEFRDAYDTYRERGIEILGVSPDDVTSHGKFKSKYELPFTLLADPGHQTAEAYGVWGERSFAGKKYMVGDIYSIVDMAFWGWARLAPFVLGDDGYAKYPNVKRLVDEVSARPAAARAIALKDKFTFKADMDDDARNIMFGHLKTKAA